MQNQRGLSAGWNANYHTGREFTETADLRYGAPDPMALGAPEPVRTDEQKAMSRADMASQAAWMDVAAKNLGFTGADEMVVKMPGLAVEFGGLWREYHSKNKDGKLVQKARPVLSFPHGYTYPGNADRGGENETDSPGVTAGVVRADEGTVRSEQALPWFEAFARQERRLREYVGAVGLPVDWQTGQAIKLEQGAEHDVWISSDKTRVFKLTRNEHFGELPQYSDTAEVGWENGAAAPAEYLRRLSLQNRIFGDDIRIEGVRTGRTVAIATSQPFIVAADPKKPHPDKAGVASFRREGRCNQGSP